MYWYIFIFPRLSSNKKAGKKEKFLLATNLMNHESRNFQIMVIGVGAPDLIQIDLTIECKEHKKSINSGPCLKGQCQRIGTFHW